MVQRSAVLTSRADIDADRISSALSWAGSIPTMFDAHAAQTALRTFKIDF
jgi:hypothetical protein